MKFKKFIIFYLETLGFCYFSEISYASSYVFQQELKKETINLPKEWGDLEGLNLIGVQGAEHPDYLVVSSPILFSQEIRKPSFAGSFYPIDEKQLSSQISSFFQSIPEIKIKEEIIGLIVPHAGYIYSGKTASYSYKSIKDKNYSLVIIIGKSHHAFFKGAIIDNRKYWETPLGKVELSNQLYEELSKNEDFYSDKIKAFSSSGEGDVECKKILDCEHSIEVQIPFLQKTLKDYKIFPILLGDSSLSNISKLSEPLYKILKNKKNYILIASTDLSHYYPLSVAEKKDKLFLETLKKKDISILKEKIDNKEVEICGDAAVFLLLKTVEKLCNYEINVLNYSTSADSSGDTSAVVGYSAVAITKEKNSINRKEKKMLNKEERKKLLQIARETLETYLSGKKLTPIQTDIEIFKEKRAVFVTLRKHGELRGCIGYIMPVEPLIEAVRKMAIEAATKDPRFFPVDKKELKDIEIEISVLTVPQKVNSADEIVLGRDGVIVKKGFSQGVFLPQVAEETGWTKEEFLNNLCSHKAGLPPDAWKQPDIELYTFQAEVFSESEY